MRGWRSGKRGGKRVSSGDGEEERRWTTVMEL